MNGFLFEENLPRIAPRCTRHLVDLQIRIDVWHGLPARDLHGQDGRATLKTTRHSRLDAPLVRHALLLSRASAGSPDATSFELVVAVTSDFPGALQRGFSAPGFSHMFPQQMIAPTVS